MRTLCNFPALPPMPPPLPVTPAVSADSAPPAAPASPAAVGPHPLPRSLPRAWQLALRSLAAVLGSYGFCWGFVTLGIAALHGLAGTDFDDAEKLAYMLGVLLYVAAFVWAFAARRLTLVWATLAGGGAAMLALGWFIQQQVLA